MRRKPCIGFCFRDAYEAFCGHMNDMEVVEEYGDRFMHNWLHTWDDGGRMLLRCRKCHGFILAQYSEYHGMAYDDYYLDYFPVSGPEEAHELNEKFDGHAIEAEFPGRWLACDPCRAPRWRCGPVE